MRLPSTVDTVVVGAGQAGLTMSWWLQRDGREHVVLDRRATLGGGWQDRWDAFQLVSPNWTASFPGTPYDGDDPDGYMPRDEIAGHVRRYAEETGAPVSLETTVQLVTERTSGGFRVETNQGVIQAREVVVATGGFHVPNVPPISGDLPSRLVQLHSHRYRAGSSLPPGAVLVVGSGQSGVQLAEELHEAGRRVYLSVGSAGRMPRRYRGRDCFVWLHLLATHGGRYGVALDTVDDLDDPRMRMAGNPHLSGHGGGHDTDLRRMAADGMALTGRIVRVEGERLSFAPDLRTNLERADRFFDEVFRGKVDRLIVAAGIDAPPDDRVPFDFQPAEPTGVDLARAGITSVLWTTGYRPDYGWIEPPVTDEMGLPRQKRGVSEVPGLYFIGSLWLYRQSSASLFGLSSDARHLADRMGLTRGAAPDEGLFMPPGFES